MKPRDVLRRALAGSKNIRFNDVAGLATAFGFRESRVRGSHHIFTHSQVPELLNLQRVGGKAKPYQVRQLLRLVERHNLTLRDES
jgi:predicted RNA binding protein YcfA (HicA-like mRNA interferase family)